MEKQRLIYIQAPTRPARKLTRDKKNKINKKQNANQASPARGVIPALRSSPGHRGGDLKR